MATIGGSRMPKDQTMAPIGVKEMMQPYLKDLFL